MNKFEICYKVFHLQRFLYKLYLTPNQPLDKQSISGLPSSTESYILLQTNSFSIFHLEIQNDKTFENLIFQNHNHLNEVQILSLTLCDIFSFFSFSSTSATTLASELSASVLSFGSWDSLFCASNFPSSFLTSDLKSLSSSASFFSVRSMSVLMMRGSSASLPFAYDYHLKSTSCQVKKKKATSKTIFVPYVSGHIGLA